MCDNTTQVQALSFVTSLQNVGVPIGKHHAP